MANSRLRARVPLGDCRAPSGAVRLGAAVSIRLPRELLEWSAGFYTVVSDAPADLESWSSVVRVYWNTAAAGAAAPSWGSVTSRLNAKRVAVRLKVARSPPSATALRCGGPLLQGDTFHGIREILRNMAEY